MTRGTDAPKPNIKTFRPEPDVARMLERARADGLRTSFILNSGAREWLTQKGYAKKRELQAA